MKKYIIIIFFLLGLTTGLMAQITVTGSTGANGSYTTLTAASTGAFARINSFSQSGNNIIIIITADCLAETGAVSLNAGLWTTLTLYPAAPGLTISGTVNNPLLALNGTSNITFNGSVNGTGTTHDLTIVNTSTSSAASTISFSNSASNNIIRYCILKGSGSNIRTGIILFSTSPTTGNGNDNNIVENNYITGNEPRRPLNAICSAGTSGRENDNNIIRNNDFFNLLSTGLASNGVYLGLFTSGWTISGNSFYEPNPIIPTVSVAYYFVRVVNSAGVNFTIVNNFIGGSAPLCGGTPMTKTGASNNAFFGISVNAGLTTVSNIQNNTIRNINWSNSLNAAWTGIEVSGGSVNIGTASGNNIGAASGNGSIVVTSSTTASNTYGIRITSPGTIDCQNNSIGSVTTSNNATNASNFYGIEYSGASGSITINNNTIGSLLTGNSVFASSSSTGNPQFVIGINNTGTGSVSITNNTISNISNGSINPSTSTNGQITGITSINGSNVISGNTINQLTIGNANIGIRQNASVCGISLSGTTTTKTISGNTISDLSNTFPSFTGGVIGLYFEGGTSGNVVSSNFIHSLSVAGSSTGANIFGIRIASGTTVYINNIISLGGNTASTIYGIYELGAANNNNSIYFNTVFIGGSPSSGNLPSYALLNNSNTNTRNFRNNIFANFRSNSGATSKHYAIRVLGTAGLTIDYNDYFAPGNGGTLGFLGTDRTTLAAWQGATGQDVNSKNLNPVFTSAGSTNATDYHIGIDLPGIAVTGIDFDFGGIARTIPPTIGAWERPLNKWKGSVASSAWNIATNWTGGTIPATDANIIFDAAPLSNCLLDGDKSVMNITNTTAYRMVTNGHKLTIKGILDFTNGAQIDASLTGSDIEFAGAVAQTIPAGAFYNNQVYSLTINNPNNITLNGALNLLNTITITSGLLDAYTRSPTFIFGSNIIGQTIESGVFLDNRLYDLTIDNSVGVSLNTSITIDNSLTINTGKRMTISPIGEATVRSVRNSGTLNLNSSSPSDIFSMMIENYTGLGSVNAQLFLTGGGSPNYNWHYVAVPEGGMPKTFFTSVNPYDLLSYNDARVVTSDFNGWAWHDGYASPGIAAGGGFDYLNYGQGYNFYNATDVIVQLTGITSIGSSLGTLPLQYSGGAPNSTIFGYNLLGNSLTCSLDWDNVSVNGTASTAVYYTTGNKWASYIPGAGGTNGATNFIPPLQGFFVKADNSGASVDFSAARAHSSQPRYKKSVSQQQETKGTGTIYPKVKLELSGTGTSDETIVWYNDEATTGYDRKYDAYKLFASESAFSQLYSSLGGINYVINGIPLPADSSIVPLGIKIAKTGSYSIIKKDYISPGAYDIFLIDKANNNFAVNLKNSDIYLFTSEAGTFTDRFILKIFNLTTDIDNPVFLTGDFNIYSFDGIVNIMPMNSRINDSKGEVRIFDLTGRMVKHVTNVKWQEGNLVEIPCKEQQGIYMVEVVSGTTRSVRKIFLR